MPNFIPLHIHTGYSFLESGILLERLFDVAQKYNYAYLGITDFDVMYGIPEFNALAKKNNIKPIFGVDLKVDENRISLFVKNETGYKNLTRIIAIKNRSKLDEFKAYYIIKEEHYKFYSDKEYVHKQLSSISNDISFLEKELLNIKKSKKRNKIKKLTK